MHDQIEKQQADFEEKNNMRIIITKYILRPYLKEYHLRKKIKVFYTFM